MQKSCGTAKLEHENVNMRAQHGLKITENQSHITRNEKWHRPSRERAEPKPETTMPHDLPEYRYIVGFLACIIGVFIVANVIAAMRGYREK